MNRYRLAAVLVAALAGALLLGPFVARRSAPREEARPLERLVYLGRQTVSITDRPVQILSFVGYHGRPDSVPERKLGFYHVLVIADADSLTPRSFDFGPTDTLDARTNTASWWAWSGVRGGGGVVRELTSRYDPHRKQVRIGAVEYPLSRGNVFVVRYDRDGRQSVRQLPRTLSEARPDRTLGAYRALLSPADRELLTLPPAPCPRRAPGTTSPGQPTASS